MINLEAHNSPPDAFMMFDHQIYFKLKIDAPDDRTLVKVGQDILEDIGYWISTNFKSNYILIEHASVRISGGHVNNPHNWQHDVRHMREDYAWQSRYELRCDTQDANWFLLRWCP